MTRFAAGRCCSILVFLLILIARPTAAESPLYRSDAAKPANAARFAKLPLSFEPNVGQTDSQVKYLARAGRGTMYFTNSSATLTMADVTIPDYSKLTSIGPVKGAQNKSALKWPESRSDGSAIRLEFAGASRHAQIEGLDSVPGVTNYFIGANRLKWFRKVPHFAKVRYRGLYPGIDAVFYGNGSEAEYDINVAANSDPSLVHFHVAGARKLEINSSGDLVAHFGHDQMVLHKPVIYQKVGSKRTLIDGGFAMADATSIRLKIGKYDRSHELVIDPTLVWASYVGGNFIDPVSRVAVDANNNPYVTGFTCSANFPQTIGFGSRTGCDAFVTKLNGTNAGVAYSSVIGGSAFENSEGIAVDAGGSAYIAGQTFSPDFPAPVGQPPSQTQLHGRYDAFVAKLDTNGNLLWSRTVGGSVPTESFLNLGWTNAAAVAIPQGCAANCPVIITGQTTTTETDFPLANAYQSAHPNDFDAILTEIDPTGASILYSTYFGGGPGPQNPGTSSWGQKVAVDGTGKIYVTGGADIATLPVTLGQSFGGVRDTWIAKFDPTSSGTSSLIWAEYLGGKSDDEASGIALDPGCQSNCPVYVGGSTYSIDFPTTADAYQTIFPWNRQAFVSKFDASGNVIYSTLYGTAFWNSGAGISVTSDGSVYTVGTTSAPDLPLVDAIQPKQPNYSELIKSTDGGNTFQSTGLPSTTSLAIKTTVDPSNPSNLLVGTLSSGVWQSQDGGVSFAQIGFAGQLATAFVDPNNDQIFYVPLLSSLQKSADGGASFSKTTDPSGTPGNVTGPVAFDTGTNPSTIYVGAGSPVNSAVKTGGVYKSIDGGATFSSVIPGLPVGAIYELAFDPNDASLYAATAEGLYRTSNFSSTGSLNIPRDFAAGAELSDGRVLIAGGADQNGNVLSSAELYNPASGKFTLDSGNMTSPRRFAMAVTLPDGTVLLAGGCTTSTGSGNPTASTEIYDPVADTFTAAENMVTARCGGNATVLSSGKVLITGGPFAELFDPGPGGMSQLVPYAVAGHSPNTATLLANGKVLVTGGTLSGNVTGVSEIYDPASGTFTQVGSLNTARFAQSAVLLPGNKVLIAGGIISNAPTGTGADTTAAEVFDGVSQFNNTSSMAIAREFADAVGLADGRVLIVGGNTPSGPDTGRIAEIYSPSTGKFSLTGSSLASYDDPAAALLLQNGRVLITAGNAGPQGPQSSAGLFDPNSFGFQSMGFNFSPSFAIAVDPTTVPSTVYATFLQGVLRLNDGFWIDFIRTNPAQGIAVDTSTTPGKLYYSNGNGELISSSDRGNTLTIAQVADFRPANALDVAAPSSSPGTIYVSLDEEFDVDVAKLSPDGSSLQFASYLGGSRGDYAQDVVVGPAGNPFVIGGTGSPDFLGATMGSLSGDNNTFVAMLPNTLCSGSCTVQASPTTTVTFPTGTSAGGNTTATNSTVGPALPGNLQLAGTNYTNITSTAVASASSSSPIMVCITYDPNAVGPIPPNKVSLLHYQTNEWVDVTTSLDTVNHIICGGVTSFSPFAIVKGSIAHVQISIKPPSSAPVPINPGSNGVLPVAILSTKTFDATTVNPASIELDGGHVNLKGKGSYQCSSQDVNGDKIADLVCQVPTNQFILEPGSDVAVLTAVTSSNLPIQGSEAVQVVP